MTDALIYRPAKTATQSGQKGTRKWVLVYMPVKPQHPDTLIGWVGGGQTTDQIRLKFDKRQQAVAYAEARGLDYEVRIPHERRPKIKSYADNFA